MALPVAPPGSSNTSISTIRIHLPISAEYGVVFGDGIFMPDMSSSLVLVPSAVRNHAKVLTLTPSCLCSRETFPLILEVSMSGAGGRERKNARDGDSGISASAVGLILPQGSIINDRLLLKRCTHATGRSLTIPDRTSPKDCRRPVFCEVPGNHMHSIEITQIQGRSKDHLWRSCQSRSRSPAHDVLP